MLKKKWFCEVFIRMYETMKPGETVLALAGLSARGMKEPAIVERSLKTWRERFGRVGVENGAKHYLRGVGIDKYQGNFSPTGDSPDLPFFPGVRATPGKNSSVA